MQRDEKPAEHAAPLDPSWWGITKSAVNQWVAHKDARLGAALAYYSVFSLGPLIVIAIAVAGLLFGQEAVRGEVAGGLKGLLGETGAQAIEAMLAAASRPNEGMLSTLIGIATLVFAAVGVVVQLKDALNTVWEVEPPPGKGIRGFARTYVLSLAGVLSLGFLLLVSMLMTTALSAVGKYISPFLPKISPANSRHCRVIRIDQRALRHDVQMATGRQGALARCVDRSYRHGCAVRGREARDRSLYRQAGTRNRLGARRHRLSLC